MNVSRAGFLKICAAFLAGRTVDASAFAPTAGTEPAAPSHRRTALRLEDASAALFVPHVNTTFIVGSAEGVGLPLRLARVTERPSTHDVEQFSLGFDAACASPLPCGTHTLHHATLGAFDLFMAPVGGGNRRNEYEACFSRHVSARDSAARARHPPAGGLPC